MANAASTDKDEQLLNAIDRAAETAYGSDEKGELSTERALAIKMYLGDNISPAPEGRSQVRDRSVFETINWILPSIVDIFANGDDVVKIQPVGPEDEAGAKQESEFINHQILNKTPWLVTVITLFIDAALTKNAYAYTYKDYKRNVTIDSYKGQTAAGVQMLLDGGNAEITKQSSYPDPTGAQEPAMDESGRPQMQMVPGPNGFPQMDPQTGQPAMQPRMQPVMLFDVTIRTTEKDGRYCIDVLPPEHCKVSDQTPSFQLEGCPYFEYVCEKSISDVRKMGFEIDDKINDEDTPETSEDQARDQFSEFTQGEREYEPSMRKIKVRTIWIEHDYDDDGIAELQRVLRVGRTLLEREEVSRIPVRSTVSLPLPHRHPGLSICDIVKDLQEVKTAILRGGLDNLYLSNNGRMGISNKVSVDDALLSRPGQPVRVDTDMPDVGGHIFPVVAPFIFPQAMEGLNYMDQVKQTRTGVNSQFQGLDASQLTQLQPGTVNQISSMAAQRVKLLARIFGMCIEGIASDLHECILKSGHKKEQVQLKGTWTEVDPSAWKKRKDFKTVVGYAAGNKDAMVTKLMMIGNAQKEALMGGLPIVTPENVYETMSELVKASDFSTPDRFFTHPSKMPPKGPPQPDPTVMAAEKMKSDTALQTKQLDVQQKSTESASTLELEKYRTDADNHTKILIAQHQTHHAKDMKQLEAEHAMGMEGVKAHLSPKTAENANKGREVAQKDTLIQGLFERVEKSEQRQEQMLAQVLSAVAALNGPKEIIRDKAGKAVGVKPSNGAA